MTNEGESQRGAPQKRIRVFCEQEEDGVCVLVPRDAGTVSDVTARLVAKLELESEPKSLNLFLLDDYSNEVKLLAGESSDIIRDGNSVSVHKKAQGPSKRRVEGSDELNVSKKQKNDNPIPDMVGRPPHRTEAVYPAPYQQGPYAPQAMHFDSNGASRMPQPHYMNIQRSQDIDFGFRTNASMFQPNPNALRSMPPPLRDEHPPSNPVCSSAVPNNFTERQFSHPSPPRVSQDGLPPKHSASQSVPVPKTPSSRTRQGPGSAPLQNVPTFRSAPMPRSADAKFSKIQTAKGPPKFQPTPPPGEAPRQSVFGGLPSVPRLYGRNGTTPQRTNTANKRQSFGGSNLGRNEAKRRNVASEDKVLNESKDVTDRPDVSRTKGLINNDSTRNATAPFLKKPAPPVEVPTRAENSRKENQTNESIAESGKERGRTAQLKAVKKDTPRRVGTVVSSGIAGKPSLSGPKKVSSVILDKPTGTKPVPGTKVSLTENQAENTLPTKRSRSSVQAKAEAKHGKAKSRNLSSPVADGEKKAPTVSTEEIAQLLNKTSTDGLIRNSLSDDNECSIVKILKHKEENAQKKKVWMICRLNTADGSSNEPSGRAKFQIKLKLTKGEIKVVVPVEKRTIEFLRQAKESARQCMSSSASKKAVYMLDETEIEALCDPDLKSRTGKVPSHISLNPIAIHSFSIGDEKGQEKAKDQSPIKSSKTDKAKIANPTPRVPSAKKEKNLPTSSEKVQKLEKSDKNESTKKTKTVDRNNTERKNSQLKKQAKRDSASRGAKVEKVKPNEAKVKTVLSATTKKQEPPLDVNIMVSALENGKLPKEAKTDASVVPKDVDMFHESTTFKLALGGLLCQIAETMETLAANESVYLGKGGLVAQGNA